MRVDLAPSTSSGGRLREAQLVITRKLRGRTERVNLDLLGVLRGRSFGFEMVQKAGTPMPSGGTQDAIRALRFP